MRERNNNQKLNFNATGINVKTLFYEIQKMLRIFIRGPNKGIVAVILIFPITFTMFMWLVFGRTYFNFPTAIVIEGYDSQSELNFAISNDMIPETSRFVDYIDNYSLVKETIVHSEVVEICYSIEEVQEKFDNLEILVVIIIPENFEEYIEKARNNQPLPDEMKIECKCANINEDLLKNLYFGIQRKLSAYYNTEFTGEIEVDYTYQNADPQKITFPRMWTIGSGGIVFSVLVASLIIGSAMVFVEKDSNMDVELVMASKGNRSMNYTGKVLATSIISTSFNFPFAAIVILSILGMGFPSHIFILIGIMLLSTLLGASLGVILGVSIKEQVFTFPINVFIILPAIFLCGGFMDVQLFGKEMLSVVSLIPFTYVFTLTKFSILPGFTWNWGYFIGLIIYTIILFIEGMIVYEKGIIKGWKK